MERINSDTFETLVMGRFDASQVRIDLTDGVHAIPTAAMAAVDREWRRQCDAAVADGRTLYDGEMFRLDSYRCLARPGDADCLELKLSKTSYRHFVGTNLVNSMHAHRIETHCWANPLGLSALIVCSDSKILFGLRGKGTYLYSGYWHTFGGMADMRDVGEDGNVSLFNAIARELDEELAIKKRNVSDMWCIGVVRDRSILQPEMIFEIHVSLSSQEMMQRVQLKLSSARDEHDRIVAIADDFSAANGFAKSHVTQFTPVALATLAHHFYLTNC